MRKLDLSNEEDIKIDTFASDWALSISIVITIIMFYFVLSYVNNIPEGETWRIIIYSISGGLLNGLICIFTYEFIYYISKWYKLNTAKKKE
jgi:hypothetical protein